MEPEELRFRIARYESVRAFASAVPVSTRTVFYWLSGVRNMRPAMAERIRSLQPPSRKEQP
jgi:hypothetical protein